MHTAHGLVTEMFEFGGDDLSKCLLRIFNSMLHTGDFEPTWRNTLFLMLPKARDTAQPSNWRPIAILKTTYRLSSKLLYGRLRPILEEEQSYDQTGFRSHTGIEDAFAVFDTVCNKTKEWNCPAWLASLDFKKAFDRIEFDSVFEALEER